MKLSRNVSITLDEAKKKSATFARATATFGETLYTHDTQDTQAYLLQITAS